MEKSIENETYYHGLLPREDVKAMLKRNGDFLLRTSEPHTGERAVILSMMVKEDKAEKGVSFYIYYFKRKTYFAGETLRDS